MKPDITKNYNITNNVDLEEGCLGKYMKRVKQYSNGERLREIKVNYKRLQQKYAVKIKQIIKEQFSTMTTKKLI